MSKVETKPRGGASPSSGFCSAFISQNHCPDSCWLSTEKAVLETVLFQFYGHLFQFFHSNSSAFTSALLGFLLYLQSSRPERTFPLLLKALKLSNSQNFLLLPVSKQNPIWSSRQKVSTSWWNVSWKCLTENILFPLKVVSHTVPNRSASRKAPECDGTVDLLTFLKLMTELIYNEPQVWRCLTVS